MSRKAWVLIATILGSGVVFLDGTIVNLALPKIAVSQGASFNQLQWIIDGYLLSLSSLLLLGGSLGDIFGRKRIYLSGIAGFSLMSLLCGLSPTVEVLIILRILQGAFGALVVPGALAIINTNFSPGERGAVIGKWTAWTAAIGAVGPLVGGYLVDIAPWRIIFFINLPLLAACWLIGNKYIVESRDDHKRRVDLGGALLAMLGLGGLVYGLIEGPPSHWAATSVISLVLGFVLLAFFVFYEKRTDDPMLKLDLFKSRNFSGANAATLAMYGALNGFFFIFIIHLQTVVGFSSFQAGLAMLPVALVLVALASRFGSLSARYGPRAFMTVGPILVGISQYLMLSLKPGDNFIMKVVPIVLLLGLGLAVTVAPLTSTVMGSVDKSFSGIASAINNAVARTSGLIVIAMLGLLGQGSAYKFGGLLCGSLAISAGLISYFSIQNKQVLQNQKST